MARATAYKIIGTVKVILFFIWGKAVFMKKNEIDKHSKTESSYRFSLLLTDVAEGGLNLPFERCGVFV